MVSDMNMDEGHDEISPDVPKTGRQGNHMANTT